MSNEPRKKLDTVYDNRCIYIYCIYYNAIEHSNQCKAASTETEIT